MTRGPLDASDGGVDSVGGSSATASAVATGSALRLMPLAVRISSIREAALAQFSVLHTNQIQVSNIEYIIDLGVDLVTFRAE